MKNPINWFEIPVNDLERAKEFYESVFEIEITIQEMNNLKMGWFPFTPEGTGATGTLMEADGYVPSHEGTMVYFSVQDIDSVLERVLESGGQVINNKFPIGQDGFCGHFEDSEGNRVALHQSTRKE